MYNLPHRRVASQLVMLVRLADLVLRTNRDQLLLIGELYYLYMDTLLAF